LSKPSRALSELARASTQGLARPHGGARGAAPAPRPPPRAHAVRGSQRAARQPRRPPPARAAPTHHARALGSYAPLAGDPLAMLYEKDSQVRTWPHTAANGRA
jgi:hypothetical protein